MEIKTDKRIDMIHAHANCYRGYANKCKEVFAAGRWREILCQHMVKNTVYECECVYVCVALL